MNTFRIYLGIGCLMLIVFHLFNMDFKDFSWVNNGGSILGIISMMLIILSLYFSHRYAKRHKQ